MECPFTCSNWNKIGAWACCSEVQVENWTSHAMVLDWFASMVYPSNPNSKGVHTLAILVIWSIWKEMNHMIFNGGENSLDHVFLSSPG
jgi:hypothetical protein